MDNKEKWVILFEKVTGRKPSPEEFIAGKNSNFDFKQIRKISGRTDSTERHQNVDKAVNVPQESVNSYPIPTASPLVHLFPFEVSSLATCV